MVNELDNINANDLEKIVDDCLRKAIAQELWKHKRLGQSIVTSRDGKVVKIPPEEINVQMEYLDPEYA